MSSNNIGSLLRRNPGLQRLQAHAVKIRRIQALLNSHLPEQLNAHYQVAALEQGVLTLHTDSPAWAAKLRFLTGNLLNIVRDSGIPEPISTIRVKARPPVTKPQDTGQRPRLSPQTTRFLRDMADTIEDPELRASLLRLSDN